MEKGRERNAGEALEASIGLAVNDGGMSEREFSISLWLLIFILLVPRWPTAIEMPATTACTKLAMRPFILGNLFER